MFSSVWYLVFFFFHNPAPTEIYTLSLHDALPIWFGSASCTTTTPAPTRAKRSRSKPPPEPISPAGRSCRSEEHTSELQSRVDLVCRLLLEKKNTRAY